MPIYEYACEECGLEFEKLLSVRFAQEAAACPECDGDAPRIVTTSFNAYIFRDGANRKLPDTARFRHYGKDVPRPINTTVEQGQHPDLIDAQRGPAPLPTAAEVEQFEALREARKKPQERTGRGIKVNAMEVEETAKMNRRMQATAERRRLAKRRPPNEAATPRTGSGKHVKPEGRSKTP